MRPFECEGSRGMCQEMSCMDMDSDMLLEPSSTYRPLG